MQKDVGYTRSREEISKLNRLTRNAVEAPSPEISKVRLEGL